MIIKKLLLQTRIFIKKQKIYNIQYILCPI